MNQILGARIRSLREAKGFTQEQVADQMHCTRQRFARMEKGLVDITYASINSIGQILGISANDITSSVNNIAQTQPMYRTNGGNQEDGLKYISTMIDTFYAHRKLYYNVRETDDHE